MTGRTFAYILLDLPRFEWLRLDRMRSERERPRPRERKKTDKPDKPSRQWDRFRAAMLAYAPPLDYRTERSGSYDLHHLVRVTRATLEWAHATLEGEAMSARTRARGRRGSLTEAEACARIARAKQLRLRGEPITAAALAAD